MKPGKPGGSLSGRRRHLTEILPRGEGLAGAGHDHAAHGVARLRVRERVARLAPHRLVEGVLAFGAIQREQQNAVGEILEDAASSTWRGKLAAC